MESTFQNIFVDLVANFGCLFLAKCFLQNSILIDKKNVVLLILAALVNVIGERWGAGWEGFFVAGEMFLLVCCFLRGGRGKLRRLFSAGESFIYFYLNIAFYVVAMYLIYNPNDSEMTFLNTSSWGGVCSFLVLLLVGYTYIYLYRKKITLKLQIRDKITLIVYCLFILSFACMWGVIAEESNMNLPKSFSVLIMFLFTILELFAFIGLIKTKLTDYYKKGQEYQQEYMEMELAHFREYKQAQDETSRVRHDMKNNLACISMLLEEGKNEEAKAYVSQLLGEVNAFSPKVVTGDEMLDAIVSSKWGKMEERQISFSMDGVLDQGLNWKPIDVCTVFSNGLDNAIEACEKVEEEREISLSLRYTKNFYYMVLSNTMVEPQDNLVIGSRFTTKKNKELHGYGLENMERTIKKYDGTMNILQEGNRFILKIMVPLEATL